MPENPASSLFTVLLNYFPTFDRVKANAREPHSSVEEGRGTGQTGVAILKTSQKVVFDSIMWLFHSFPMCPFFNLAL